jgi:hypothetical protein
MQEAGAGVTTVTTPGERHRTTPSTTALHMLATCDPPLLRPATCNAHLCPPMAMPTYAHPAVG